MVLNTLSHIYHEVSSPHLYKTYIFLTLIFAPILNRGFVPQVHSHDHLQVFKAFYKDYEPTIEEAYEMQQKTELGNLTVKILDTAGSPDLGGNRNEWISQSDAFLLVYSVSDPRSFEEIPHLIEEILQIKCEEEWSEYMLQCVPLPIVVVANKCDREVRRISVNFIEANSLVCTCVIVLALI